MGKAVSFEIRKEEAENLRRILGERGYGGEREKNFAQFSREFKIPGGKSLLSQHLNCDRPISAQSGKAYAKSLNCLLREISPRLAELVNEPPLSIQSSNTSQYNVVKGNFSDDRIRQVIDIMQATDSEGRIKCLEAVKWAMRDHKPAKKGQLQ